MDLFFGVTRVIFGVILQRVFGGIESLFGSVHWPLQDPVTGVCQPGTGAHVIRLNVYAMHWLRRGDNLAGHSAPWAEPSMARHAGSVWETVFPLRVGRSA